MTNVPVGGCLSTHRAVYIIWYLSPAPRPHPPVSSSLMSRPPRKRAARRPPEAPNAAVVTEAKLFQNGRSQAVRLPAAYRFAGDTVYVKHWRGAVILFPKRHPWAPLVESLGKFSGDFMAEREQPAPRERPGLEALFD